MYISDGTTLTYHELQDLFDEYLDDFFPKVTYGNSSYTASDALKYIDPVAYCCEFAGWLCDQESRGILLEDDNA